MSRFSNTCNGDSGGSVLIADRDGARIVQKLFGVVSGGLEKNCVKKDLSFNVDVREFSDWIKQAGEGRLGSSMCGAPPPSDKAGVNQHAIERLSASKSEASIAITVPTGARTLRVALNGEDNGEGNFDLYVFRSDDRGMARPACRQEGPGQFAFCEINSPEPGQWKALVKRKTGEGQAQLVITLQPRS